MPGRREPFDARILRANGALDPGTRLVTVRAAVANTVPETEAGNVCDGARRDGRASSVRDGASRRGAALRRATGRVSRPSRTVEGGAKFIRREVQTGTTANGRTHITTGLNAGDVVVTDGAFAVRSQFSRSKMPMGG